MPSVARACELDVVQKQTMLSAFCRMAVGVMPAKGCTADLMKLQAAEQLHEIALARRCGFMVEADTLEKYYRETTPIVGKLYSCVDQPIDQPDVEKGARQIVDGKLAAAPEGCPDDLRRRLSGDLPKAIDADRKSFNEMRAIAEQLKLK